MGTMVRCEYCGQLYEGLSCPHCCAPRSDDSDVDIFYADGVPYWRSDVGFIDPEEHPESVDYFLVDIDPYKDENSDVVDKIWVQYGEGTPPVLLGGDESIDKNKEWCNRVSNFLFALGGILMLIAFVYAIHIVLKHGGF